MARGGVEPPTYRFSDGRQNPMQWLAVPFDTICYKFGAIGCDTVSMNATHSSHFLSSASLYGSLYGRSLLFDGD